MYNPTDRCIIRIGDLSLYPPNEYTKSVWKQYCNTYDYSKIKYPLSQLKHLMDENHQKEEFVLKKLTIFQMKD